MKVKRIEKEEEKKEGKMKKIESHHSMEKCEECGKPDLRINHVEGTIVCTECGLVNQSRIIDDSSEWRTFNSENSNSGANPNRVGGRVNPYLTNYGIDTQVKGQNAADIQKWNDRSSLTAKDKQITKGHRMIKDIQTTLNIKDPTVVRA